MSSCTPLASFSEEMAPERERLAELGRMLDAATLEQRNCESEAEGIVIHAEIEELKAERDALVQGLIAAFNERGLRARPDDGGDSAASPGCAQHSPPKPRSPERERVVTLLKDCRRLLPGSTLGDKLRSRIGAQLREWGES